MTLYNMLYGQNIQLLALVSAILELRIDKEIPRFRDIFTKADDVPEEFKDYNFIIYTRMGGGNYTCWENWEENCQCPYHRLCKIEEMPWYEGGYNDEDDNTYRNLIIKLSPEQRDLYQKVINKNPEAIEIIKNRIMKLFQESSKEEK